MSVKDFRQPNEYQDNTSSRPRMSKVGKSTYFKQDTFPLTLQTEA